MQVHVLGYWGTYPGPGEATTGFLVEHGETRVLLDCGSGVLAQLHKLYDIADLSAVVITHHHHDHNADLGILGYEALLARITGQRSKPLDVYMPQGAPEITREFEQEPLISLHTVNASSRLTIGDLTVTFAETVHAVPCLAVRFEADDVTFVFSADSSVCDNLTQLARGAHLFLCEASMFDGQEETAKQTGHLTARQAGQLAKEAGVRDLVLTHYPHYGNIEDLVQQASESFGRDALRIETLQTLVVNA